MTETEGEGDSPRNINNNGTFDHVVPHDHITDLSISRLESVNAETPQESELSPDPVITHSPTHPHILHHQTIDQEGDSISTSTSPLLPTIPLQRVNLEPSIGNESTGTGTGTGTGTEEDNHPRHDHSYHNGVDLADEDADTDMSTNKHHLVQHQHDIHLCQQAVAHMYNPHSNITYNMNINDANDHYNSNATNMASLYEYETSLPQAQHQPETNAATDEDQTQHPMVNTTAHGHVFDASIQQGLSYHLQDGTNITGHHSTPLGSHQPSHHHHPPHHHHHHQHQHHHQQHHHHNQHQHHHHQLYDSHQLNTDCHNNQPHLHTGFIQTHNGEQRGAGDIQHQEAARSFLHLPPGESANNIIQVTQVGNFQPLQNTPHFHVQDIHPHEHPQAPMMTITNQPASINNTVHHSATTATKGKKVPAEIAWRNKYQELVEFHAENGHSDVPQLYSKNRSLGKWVGKQREHYKLRLKLQTESLVRLSPPLDTRYSSSSRKASCPLTDERVELLKKVDFKFSIGKGKHALHHGTFSSCDALTQVWEQKFKSLKEFKQVYGHTDVPLKPLPQKHVPLDGQLLMDEKTIKTLGRWVATQKRKYQSVKVKHEVSSSQVLEDRFKRLQALGFDFGVPGATVNMDKFTLEDTQRGRGNQMHWNDRYKELCDFAKTHGHANVPQTHKENIQLARWVSSQREMWKQRDRERKSGSTIKPGTKPCNALTDERILLLEKVGFHFSIFHKSFIEKVAQLKSFKESHGHLNVKCSGETKKLYDWIHRQRSLFRQYMEGGKFSDRTGSNPMTSERVAMLEEIGFDWQYDFEQVKKSIVKDTTLNAAEGKEQKKRKTAKKRKLDATKKTNTQKINEDVPGQDCSHVGKRERDEKATTPACDQAHTLPQMEQNPDAVTVNIVPDLSEIAEVDNNTLATDENVWKENQVSDACKFTNVASDIASTVQTLAFQETRIGHFPDESTQDHPILNHASNSQSSNDRSTYHIHETVNNLIQREQVRSVHKKGTKPEIWHCHYDQLVEYKNRFSHCRVPGVSSLYALFFFKKRHPSLFCFVHLKI